MTQCVNLTDAVIFTAQLTGLTSQENARRLEELVAYLNESDISYLTVVGSWQGVEEDSVAIPSDKWDGDLEQLVLGEYEQDCVLHTSGDQCYLQSFEIPECDPMVWAETDEDTARQLDAWSYIPDTGQYFIAAEGAS